MRLAVLRSRGHEGEGTCFPEGAADVAEGGAVVGMGLAERGKVLGLEQDLGGFVHEVVVEVESGEGDEVVGIGVLDVRDPVLVGAGGGVEAGVGGRLDGDDAMDGDVLRQKTVQFERQIVQIENGQWTMDNGQWFGEVEVGDHEAGMDAGVGSACGGEGNGLSEEGGEGGLHLFLNAHRVRLELPAVVGCAVVGEVDKCSHLFS